MNRLIIRNIFAIILFFLFIGCNNQKEVESYKAQIERLRQDSIARVEKEKEEARVAAELAKLEAEKKEKEERQKYDGLHEWYVIFSDIARDKYKEEFGVEIRDGKLVSATWYSYPKNGPMKGTLNGDILELEGNNTVYTSLWMKIKIDLRTNRGTISNNLVPPQEVKFYKND